MPIGYLKFKGELSINNTFKSPILFKYFEKEIPSNKIIICEIKSGFDIDRLKKAKCWESWSNKIFYIQ